MRREWFAKPVVIAVVGAIGVGIIASQVWAQVHECMACRKEGAELVEKMKAANIDMKKAIELAEKRVGGVALTAYTEWSEDGTQPLFAVYVSLENKRLVVVEVTHEGKAGRGEPAEILPSIHDDEAHKPKQGPAG